MVCLSLIVDLSGVDHGRRLLIVVWVYRTVQCSTAQYLDTCRTSARPACFSLVFSRFCAPPRVHLAVCWCRWCRWCRLGAHRVPRPSATDCQSSATDCQSRANCCLSNLAAAVRRPPSIEGEAPLPRCRLCLPPPSPLAYYGNSLHPCTSTSSAPLQPCFLRATRPIQHVPPVPTSVLPYFPFSPTTSFRPIPPNSLPIPSNFSLNSLQLLSQFPPNPP